MRLFGTAPFYFRFFRGGWSDYSDELVERIKTVLNEKVPRHYDLDVIDVFLKPSAARADGVYATPMLIMVKPEPVRKFFGALNNVDELRKALAFLDDEFKKMSEPPPPKPDFPTLGG